MPASTRLIVLAVLALCAPFAAACGGESDETAVRDTLERFAGAVAEKDYQELCDDLLDPELLDALRSRNVPCEVALRTGLEEVRRPSLTIGRVRVDGNRASATVRTTAQNQPPSEDDMQLIKRGGTWRISRLES